MKKADLRLVISRPEEEEDIFSSAATALENNGFRYMAEKLREETKS